MFSSRKSDVTVLLNRNILEKGKTTPNYFLVYFTGCNLIMKFYLTTFWAPILLKLANITIKN